MKNMTLATLFVAKVRAGLLFSKAHTCKMSSSVDAQCGVSQLVDLPWVVDVVIGGLQHVLADLQGNVATVADFKRDAHKL